MTIRLTILKVCKDYYIGRDNYTKKKFKVVKNEHIRPLKKNDDYEFYCRREKRFLRDILIPISEEEAFKMDN